METRLILLVTMYVISALGAQISVAPSSQVINVNQNTSVAIRFDDNLGDFDINIGWNNSIVQFLSYSLGPSLGNPALTEAVTGNVTGANTLNVFEVSLMATPDLLALQGALPLTLLTLNFKGLAAGTSPVTLGINTIGDEAGLPFSPAVTMANGAITVQQNGGPIVPEPGTIFLFLGGSAALFIGRRMSSRV